MKKYFSKVAAFTLIVASPAIAQVRQSSDSLLRLHSPTSPPDALLTANDSPVVMPDTPSGAGDPNAVVCRASQRMADGTLGPQVCLHNAQWWKVAVNGKDLAADGKTFFDRPTVKNPTGEGDPDAMTCRTPQYIWHGPLVPVCRLNSFWADVTKNHLVVGRDGTVMTRNMGSSGGGNDGFGAVDPTPFSH